MPAGRKVDLGKPYTIVKNGNQMKLNIPSGIGLFPGQKVYIRKIGNKIHLIPAEENEKNNIQKE